jgi:hypothetical protein
MNHTRSESWEGCYVSKGGTADRIRRLKRSRCYRIRMLKSHCPTFQKNWCRQKRKANVLHSQRHSAGTEEVARLNEKPGSRNTDYSSSRGTHKLALLPSVKNLSETIIIIFSAVINLRERFAFPENAKLMA